jgi:eukaryotic-like serine/threonine-protein kinase
LNAEVSPDGRWLAYQSDESGRDEISVRPFPNVQSSKWSISTNGGVQPLWARNGRELFYVSASALMRVPVTTTPKFEAGVPIKLFEGQYALNPLPGGGMGRMYDVSPDGQRFLMIKEANDAELPFARIVVVQNWLKLKRASH